MFGKLNNRESLRDLIVALYANQSKRYHLGLDRDRIAKVLFQNYNLIFHSTMIKLIFGFYIVLYYYVSSQMTHHNTVILDSSLIIDTQICWRFWNFLDF